MKFPETILFFGEMTLFFWVQNNLNWLWIVLFGIHCFIYLHNPHNCKNGLWNKISWNIFCSTISWFKIIQIFGRWLKENSFSCLYVGPMPCFTFANVKLPYNNFVLFCFRWQNMYVYLMLISKSLRSFAFPVAKLFCNIFTIFTLCMFLYVYFTKSLNAVEANMKFKSNISWC